MGRARPRNVFFLCGAALVVVLIVSLFFLHGESPKAPEVVTAPNAPHPTTAVLPNAREATDDALRRGTSKLPPEGVPWKAAKHELFARALRGDKAAAERLFRDTQTCGKTLLQQNQLTALSAIPLTGQSESKAEELRKLQDTLRNGLAKTGTACAEEDSAELGQSVDQILLAAAQAGSGKAAACYLNASFHDLVGTPAQDEFERYKMLSGGVIEAALAQGNWDVVSVMASAYGSGRKEGLYGQLVQTDPAKEYAYVKLQELGAIDGLRDAKAEQAKSIVASAHLSEEDVRQSDEWASSMFSKYFHTPLGNDQPPDCFESGPGRGE
jgi:hypothetical protein